MSKEYFFKEGCFIEEWLNTPDDPDLSIAKVRVEALQTTKLHALTNTTERYAILSGVGMATVGDKDITLSKGDVVTIAPGVPQKIKNLEKENLVFLAICTPRFEESNYQQLED